MLDWSSIDTEHFQDVAHMLIKRVWSIRDNRAKVSPINGRGGDRGVDVQVETSVGVAIYQLKYFKDGMSGGFDHRKGQVKRSWESVKDRTDLIDWILVVPCELTTWEYDFVRNLDNPNEIPISIMTKVDLDLALAENSDIARFAERTEKYIDDARILHQEQALLLNPVPDLLTRASQLGLLGSEANPDWDFSFSHDQGKTTVGMRPKSSEVLKENPLSINLGLQFQREGGKLQEFQKIVGFALDRELNLDNELQNIVFSSPLFPKPEGEFANLTMHPETHIPETLVNVPVSISLNGDHDARISTYVGVTEHFAFGYLGFSWRLVCFHSIRITFFGPRTLETETPSPEMELSPQGASPSDVRSALRFLTDLTSTRKFVLKTTVGFGGSWSSAGYTHGSKGDISELISFTEDLIAIEELAKIKFVLSQNISPFDAVLAKIVRSLLEGKISATPMMSEATAMLTNTNEEGRATLFSGPRDDIRIPFPQFAITLLGIDIQIGQVELWHPRTQAKLQSFNKDRNEHRAAFAVPPGECFLMTPARQDASPLGREDFVWPLPGNKAPKWFQDIVEGSLANLQPNTDGFLDTRSQDSK